RGSMRMRRELAAVAAAGSLLGLAFGLAPAARAQPNLPPPPPPPIDSPPAAASGSRGRRRHAHVPSPRGVLAPGAHAPGTAAPPAPRRGDGGRRAPAAPGPPGGRDLEPGGHLLGPPERQHRGAALPAPLAVPVAELPPL